MRAVRIESRPLLPPGYPAVPRECPARRGPNRRSTSADRDRSVRWQHGVRVAPVTGSEPHASRYGLTMTTLHRCRLAAPTRSGTAAVSRRDAAACQALVRFWGAVPLSPVFRRLCRRSPIPLDFSLAAVLPRRETCRVSCAPEPIAPPARGPRASLQLLGPGLTGSPIPLAPLAFAPQRQGRPRELPSPSVFLPISTHFTAPPGIPLPSTALKPGGFRRRSRVEPGALTPDGPGRLGCP